MPPAAAFYRSAITAATNGYMQVSTLDADPDHHTKNGTVTRWAGVLGRLVQALMIITAMAVAIPAYNGTLFAWHPICMSLGYLLLMTKGMHSAILFRGVAGSARVPAIQAHALWQLCAGLCISIGFLAIYRNKAIHNKSHFLSNHARIGLVALVLSVLAPIGGALGFKWLGILGRMPEALQPRIKQMHRLLGLWTWIIALGAIMLALPHPAVYRGTWTWVTEVLVAALAACMLLLQRHTGAQIQGRSSNPLSKAI